MPTTKSLFLLILSGVFVSQVAQAMVFDNRFIPLIQRPILRVDDSQSEFASKFFVTTANKSLSMTQQDEELSDIFGKFDQVELAKGIQANGKPNPLPSEFQGHFAKIPWLVDGKRQSQGVAFAWHQQLYKYISTGFSWLFMRVESRHTFKFNSAATEPRIIRSGDAVLLDDNRRDMFKEINIREGNTAQLGFGDIDWYMRFGNTWDYTLRFRRIDAGFRVGALFPTGLTRELDRPASIPFGGNGHWGMYVAADGLFELREDWKAGFQLRLNKRFSKTRYHRMPAAKEPSIWGAVVAPACVNPGATLIFAPYFMLDNLRQGLTLGLNLTLTWHQKDCWRTNCETAQLQEVERRSEWRSEYFTINVLYDFGKVSMKRELNPILTFRWDVPSTLFIAQGVNRTQRVTLGLDFVF